MLSGKIKQVAALLRRGQISASDICEKCLRRIRSIEELNAYVTVTRERATTQAQETDKRIQSDSLLGLMDGIPVAYKDNFSTKGVQTSCASKMLLGYRAPYNATVVQRLQDEGAIMMGKVNMDEFAMGCGTIDSIHGPTKNPWKYSFSGNVPENKPCGNPGQSDRQTINTIKSSAISKNQNVLPSEEAGTAEHTEDWYIAGGSSGGSAVAVATGTVFGALGSDTGGSVRNPAAYCGIVGLKPTYGLLSRHGLIPLVNSMDVPGILGRCVDDVTTLLNCLAGHDPLDSTTLTQHFQPVAISEEPSVKELHIGIPKEYHAPGISNDVMDAWSRAADLLEAAGARVTQVSLPHTQLSIQCYSALCCCEVASNMARFDGIEYGHRVQEEVSTEALYAASRHEGFGEVIRSRILAGNYFLLKENYEKYFMQALKLRRLIAEDFQQVFESGVDVLLTPTVLSEAPKYSWFSEGSNRERTMEQDVFTQPVNLAGIPAVTIPATLSAHGLPVSLQLISRSLQESTLLNAAKWMEQQLEFPSLDMSHLDS